MDAKKNVGSVKRLNRLSVKLLVILVIALVLVISVSRLFTPNGVKEYASLEEFTAYLNERIPALMKEYEIPGVNIALVQKGEAAWSNAYGYADLEEGRKMTTDTYCRVESISKSVTSWGVIKLVEQGKIELDQPVALYLKNWEFPESNFSVEKVTVRQLLSHSAGFPLGDIFERYSPDEKMPSLEESLSDKAILMQEPGLSFGYSNTGFNLLELLIEEVTGRDFAEYMEEEILIPLGMRKSSFTWSEELKPAIPVGYDLQGNPISIYIYPEKSSGGLFATVEDIATFVTAGMTTAHGVLTPQGLDALYTPVVQDLGFYSLVFDGYGFGHYIENLSNGKKAVSHGGQGGGCMTHFHSVPETGDGIVILTNSQRSWPFFAYILSDWAKWNGFASIGMGKIIWGQNVLLLLIGLICVMLLWQIWRLGKGLVSGKRQFALRSKEARLLRFVQSGFAIVLLAVILWCVNQDYLFISTIFPIAYRWLGLSVLVTAVVLLLTAVLPDKEES